MQCPDLHFKWSVGDHKDHLLFSRLVEFPGSRDLALRVSQARLTNTGKRNLGFGFLISMFNKAQPTGPLIARSLSMLQSVVLKSINALNRTYSYQSKDVRY